jgi:ribonuclease HII
MGVIYQSAVAYGIGWASPAEIDSINILRASLLAMKRAFEAMLNPVYTLADQDGAGVPSRREGLRADSVVESLDVVVDGLYVPEIDAPCRALVRADSLVPEVMAASILAKTARDRMMLRYSWLYPEYGYEKHKGYPTKEHRQTVIRLGPSPIQRVSFKVR